MPTRSSTYIVRDSLSASHYRVVKHQPDDMPEFFMGKPMATLAEAELSADSNDTYWDQPDPIENQPMGGIVRVKRFVDMRDASGAFRQRLADAAGGRRSLRITMSTVSRTGVFAWIETHADVASVVVACDGKVYLEQSLGRMDPLDWGYEGCAAVFLKWYGERLVVVSTEKSIYVSSFDPVSGEKTGFPVSGAWAIDGNLLLWLNEERGLVQTTWLPSLDRGLPLPFNQLPKLLNCRIRLQVMPQGRLGVLCSEGGSFVIETLGLPTREQRAVALTSGWPPTLQLLDWIDSHLFPDLWRPSGRQIMIESIAYPFFGEALSDRFWRPSLVWMPAYWHRHLLLTNRIVEAAEFLDILDRFAAQMHEEALSFGWNPEWSPQTAWVTLATIHVRRTCRVVADVCRSGKLPVNTWHCLLFDPEPGGGEVCGSRMDPSRFPPALRQAFNELLGSQPLSLTRFIR